MDILSLISAARVEQLVNTWQNPPYEGWEYTVVTEGDPLYVAARSITGFGDVLAVPVGSKYRIMWDPKKFPAQAEQ